MPELTIALPLMLFLQLVMSLNYAFLPTGEEREFIHSIFWNSIEKLVHEYPNSGLEQLDRNSVKNGMDMSSLYTM